MSSILDPVARHCTKCSGIECDIEISDINILFLEVAITCIECDTTRYETFYAESAYEEPKDRV